MLYAYLFSDPPLSGDYTPRQSQQISMNEPALKISGSKWDVRHLRTLHVKHLDNLDCERFLDKEWIPNYHEAINRRMRHNLLCATEDELRTRGPKLNTKVVGTPFQQTLLSISSQISTGTPSIPGLSHASTPSSDLSHSSDEGSTEEVPRSILQSLVGTFLLESSLCSVNQTYCLDMRGSDITNHITLGKKIDSDSAPRSNKKGNVETRSDGGVVIYRQSGGHTGSSRIGRIPIISFEAKIRHAGGTRHRTGEGERFNPNVLAQEVSLLLGQAVSNCKATESQRWSDQEGWLLSIHGTEVRLVTAYFSSSYLAAVNSDSALGQQHELLVFRSEPINLKYDAGRAYIPKVMIGLLRYLIHGNPQIAALQAATNKQRANLL